MNMSVKGKVGEIRLLANEYLLPLFEVIVNAIQSIEDCDRKGVIKVTIVRDKQQTLLSFDGENLEYPVSSFIVEDNGVGFTNVNFDSFNDAYSEINKHKGCKGVGRFTVLACFKNIEIESCFRQNSESFYRKFTFSVDDEILPHNGGLVEGNHLKGIKTTVRLNNYLTNYRDKSKVSLEHISEKVLEHCLLYYVLGVAPTIILSDEDKNVVLDDFYHNAMYVDKSPVTITVNSEKFTVYFIRRYNKRSHVLNVCANSREVGKGKNLAELDTLLSSPFADINNTTYWLSIYVTGDYLDKKVNTLRNDFDIPYDVNDKGIYEKLSMSELYEETLKVIHEHYFEDLTLIEKKTNERVNSYIINPKNPRLEYRYLQTIPNAFRDIPSNASDDKLEEHLHRVSYRIQKERKKRLDSLLRKRKIENFKEYSESIKEVLSQEAQFNKNKLADYLVNRKAILKLFRRFLDWDNEQGYNLEEDLHNIIFTMGATSDDMPSNYHNLWLLDERLTFHSFVASDKKLSSNPVLDSNSKKEPDVLVFDFPWAYSDDPNKINSLVAFEFKRPGRDLNTKSERKIDQQLVEYFELLSQSKAKTHKGKYINIETTTPKFGYMICELPSDLVEYNIQWNGFHKTPHGTLYKINEVINLHIEAMTYDQLLDTAEKRHAAFFRELGIDNI